MVLARGRWDMNLSRQKFESLLDAGRLSLVAKFSTHPAPGLFYSDPYEGESVYVDDQKRVIAFMPDEKEGKANHVQLLGLVDSNRGLAEILSHWIVQRDHEVSLAVQQHFLGNISRNDDWWISLHMFYWSETSTEYLETLGAVDQQLLATNELYRELVRIIKSNNLESRSDYQIDYMSGFTDVYRKFKYQR